MYSAGFTDLMLISIIQTLCRIKLAILLVLSDCPKSANASYLFEGCGTIHICLITLWSSDQSSSAWYSSLFPRGNIIYLQSFPLETHWQSYVKCSKSQLSKEKLKLYKMDKAMKHKHTGHSDIYWLKYR